MANNSKPYFRRIAPVRYWIARILEAFGLYRLGIKILSPAFPKPKKGNNNVKT